LKEQQKFSGVSAYFDQNLVAGMSTKRFLFFGAKIREPQHKLLAPLVGEKLFITSAKRKFLVAWRGLHT